MQLRTARLCLDCEEVHDDRQCPICASETFTYLVRWVPSDERRRRPRADAPPAEPEVQEGIDAFRRLISPDPTPQKGRHLLKKGMVGLAALGVAGWLWGGRKDGDAPRPPAAR